MTIDDPQALESLISRLRALRPDAARRWGTLDAGEMLCHLFDGYEWLLGPPDPADAEPAVRSRWFLKWVALYSPVPWAKGAQTDPSVDPRLDGTRPSDFEADRERAIEALRAVAAVPPERLSPTHPLFGPMSARDWYRSCYRHADHHLRQFGV